jgi:hypothetical protein
MPASERSLRHLPTGKKPAPYCGAVPEPSAGLESAIPTVEVFDLPVERRRPEAPPVGGTAAELALRDYQR